MNDNEFVKLFQCYQKNHEQSWTYTNFMRKTKVEKMLTIRCFCQQHNISKEFIANVSNVTITHLRKYFSGEICDVPAVVRGKIYLWYLQQYAIYNAIFKPTSDEKLYTIEEIQEYHEAVKPLSDHNDEL